MEGGKKAAPKLLHFVAWKGNTNLCFVDSFLLTLCSFPKHWRDIKIRG